MAVNARMIIVGRASSVVNNTLNYTSSVLKAATDKKSNATLLLIDSLVFAESKSVRTSTIILAAFNVLAAFTTASSILYDCYWASKRCNPKFKASKFCVSSIHPAETFPLILALGIVLQGLVFAGVQGQGLASLYTTGCHVIAQFMWPALFIVPYVQMVFGLECAIRSFRAIPFQARGKYDVTICCSVVFTMLIATWVPSHIYPESDTCFASLLWFVTRYGKLGFILLTTSASLMIISALTIFIRLSCVNLIDEHQRITASRMVYYLIVGIVSLAFVIPFFFSLTKKGGETKLSMMGTVVLNLSGLMNGLLQLFLRSNTQTTSFGVTPKRSWDLGKHDIRIFGPNELVMHAQLMNPVTGPQTPGSDVESSWVNSRASLVGVEKGPAISMESLTAKTYEPEMSSMPSKPEPAVSSSPSRGHAQKNSYSIFPGNQSTPTKPPQTTSVYDISDLEPPPTIHFPDGPRHKRDSSVASSATVQIGLRLSHAPRPSQEDINMLPLPSTTYKAKTAESNTLALPSTTYKTASALPISKFSAAPISPPTVSVSPLKVDTSVSALTPPIYSPQRPSPLNTNAVRSPDQSPTRQAAAVNKTLPPTPKFVFPKVDNVRDSNTHLSPAVYAPEKKILTLGLTTLLAGPRSAAVPPSNPLQANPLGSPSVTRSDSGRAQPATQPSSKDAWI